MKVPTKFLRLCKLRDTVSDRVCRPRFSRFPWSQASQSSSKTHSPKVPRQRFTSKVKVAKQRLPSKGPQAKVTKQRFPSKGIQVK